MMKDFDFDEIDRAVNSASAGTSLASDEVKPINQSANESNPNPAVPTPTSTPALAGRRSSGQFMDVVHPSSNMRKPPFKMPERVPTPNPVTNSPTTPSTPIEPSLNNETSSNPAESATMPDPIEFNNPNTSPESDNNSTSPAMDEDADIDQISDDITKELSQKSGELPETPFISGTKVEKRPLGAFSGDQSSHSGEQTKDEESNIKAKSSDGEELLPKTNESLPDELQNKLLKIESADASTDPVVIPEVDTSTIKVTTPESFAPVADTAAEKEPPVPIENKPVTQKVENKPIVATSISQQYKEQLSTNDQKSGAIYDTDSYHKTLSHPPKNKSGWLWVVWIILLLVIGVGAGVAAYNYVLPLL